MERTTVFCKDTFEGIHRFDGAPSEVVYLRQPHRHMFGVQIELEVKHDDREVEFVMLKHRLREWLHRHCVDGVWPMNTMSCEQLAKLVIEMVSQLYSGRRWIKVTVDEDGENGASVETEANGNDA